MKCAEVEAIIIDYLDNNLDPALRSDVEKHLETCEKCLDEVRESQQVLQLLSKDVMVQPDDSMKINFYHMLHTEIKKNEAKSNKYLKVSAAPWYTSSFFRIAAGIALLIGGTVIGLLVNSGSGNSSAAVELKQLQREVALLKRTAMLTMLKDESSSYRIQAVNYADDLKNPDENIINVLVRTLNNDKNVNVRMATAYALAKFADQKPVCDSLVESLSRQIDPILQVTLINILVERREKSALKPIQEIISNTKTLKEVKSVAEQGAKLLL